MNEKRITVYEVPEGQPRPKFAVRGRHTVVYDPHKEKNLWIKHIISQQVDEVIDAPISMEIESYMPIPKSTSKKKKREMETQIIKHTKKPDIDNIMKKYLDCMNGLVFRDDSLIWKVSMVKRYSDSPRTVITVRW